MKAGLASIAALALLTACGTSSGGGGYYYAPGTGTGTGGTGTGTGSSADTGTAGASDGASLGGSWSDWKPNQQQGGSLPTGEYGAATVQTELEPSELFKEAALACAELIVDQQKQVVAACQPSTKHGNALGWAVQAAQYQISTDARLAGLDWPPQLATAPYPAPTGDAIQVYGCATDPMGKGNLLNAFAMQQAVWMIDPLLFAFAESAAAWDRIRDDVGPTLTEAAKEQLFSEIAATFLHAKAGDMGKVVPLDEVVSRLTTSAFAWQTYVGALTFVVFHEIGHANLSHGLIKCALGSGVETLLAKRGITLDAAQQEKLKIELSKIGRSTEAQADIYGLTMLKSAGFTKDGPLIFIVGMMGVKMIGCLEQGMAEDAAVQCALQAYDPATTSHPPLGERAALIQKIFDQGQDLTYLLQPANLKRVREKACGDGTCQPTENAQTCPDDCARRPTPVCGDGICSENEAAFCKADCQTKHYCDDACGGQGEGCYCDASCKEYGDCCGPDGTDSGAKTCAGSTCQLCQ